VTEANGLMEQADSADKLHINFTSRELVGRTNLIQYGFDSPGNLNIFTFGSTALTAYMSLIDRAASERLNAAKNNFEMNVSQSKQYQNDLIYLLMLSYANTQRLISKLAAILVAMQRDNEILSLAKTKVRSGAGLSLDVMRAQSLVEMDKIKQLDLETALQKSYGDLRVLIGNSDLQIHMPILKYRQFNPEDTIKLTALAKETRPDIKASKFMTLAARSLRVQAEKDSSIKLALFGDIGIVGTHLVGGVGSAATGTIGIQLSFPIFDGGFQNGKVQEAGAKAMKAEYQEKQLNIELEAQVKNALAVYEQSKKTYEATENQITTAEKEMKLSRTRFASGAASGLEMANAQGSLATALDLNIEATFGHEVAKINYFKALGDFEKYVAEE
jgi:outer membrane protein TolC